MIPAALQLQPINDEARNGETWLLFGAGQFALVRWTGEAWAFANGFPLDFEPERYLPREASDAAAARLNAARNEGKKR